MGKYETVANTAEAKMASHLILFVIANLCLILPTTSVQTNEGYELPKILYLTFDDGPNEGTPNVLDTLKKHGVAATFFINSINLDNNGARAEDMIMRTIREGHTLADHSYDHMKHNNYDYQQNYKNLDTDLQYFGEMNAQPVLDVMHKATAEWGEAKVVPHAINFVNYSINSFVRLPYTNAWRVQLGELDIKADCPTCTVPYSSGQIGIQIADALAAEGKFVIGWDQEWNINWGANRPQYSGADMYRKLNLDRTKSPRKIVLLMHDSMFRPSYSAHELDVTELDNFIVAAKQSGYTFSTIEEYLSDDPYTTVRWL